MSKVRKIADYKFEKMDDTFYLITFPDGHAERKYAEVAKRFMRELQKEEEKKAPDYEQKQKEKEEKELKKLQLFCDTLNLFQDKVSLELKYCCIDMGAGLYGYTPVATKKQDNSTYMFWYI